MNYNNVFEENFRITTNMLDSNNFLKPSSILDIAQCAASDHAEILHLGFNDLIKKNYIWVVIRNKVEIIKNLKDLKVVKVVTFPNDPRFIEYPREVLIYNEDDELLYKIKQVWTIINIKTNEIVTEKFENYGSDHPSLFLERVKKISSLHTEDLELINNIKIPYSYCDHNGHLNNSHYLDFYIDSSTNYNKLGIKSFQIEYLKQAYLNNVIDILYKYSKEDNKDRVLGKINGEKIFYLEVNYN